MTIGRRALNALHSRAVFSRRVRVLSRHVARALAGGASVLDVGCGDGSIARAIMDLDPRIEIRGIDVLRRAKTLIPVDLFDGRRIPFADASFDWVMLIDVLHHTDDPQVLLGEAARVARTGVVIKDHLRDGFAARATLGLMDWVGNRGHGVRLPYNYLSRAEWEPVFAGCGLEVAGWDGRLGLYPFPAGPVFDRGLHFVATLRPGRRPARSDERGE